MTTSVAELLVGIIREEVVKLGEYNLNLGPTTRDMYGGLYARLLKTAIPEQLELKIIIGFIPDGKDYLFGQIDCMLVQGEGEKTPYTEFCKWCMRDVIVVFEIKKNLYSKELIDSFGKFRLVS